MHKYSIPFMYCCDGIICNVFVHWLHRSNVAALSYIVVLIHLTSHKSKCTSANHETGCALLINVIAFEMIACCCCAVKIHVLTSCERRKLKQKQKLCWMSWMAATGSYLTKLKVHADTLIVYSAPMEFDKCSISCSLAIRSCVLALAPANLSQAMPWLIYRIRDLRVPEICWRHKNNGSTL